MPTREHDPATREFAEFVDARWSALYRTAYLMLGDHASAEDLVQAALAKAYSSWARIRTVEAPDAYVRRILVTTALSWWRRKSWGREHPTETLPEALIDGPADGVAQREWVWAEVRRLPSRPRAVVVLRYYEDLTEQQIADLIGCSPGTVKSQAHAALATLRGRLGEEIVPSLMEEERHA
jgi:RNA polymerase sigma-70 factor (sigma-E family)